MAQFNAGKNPPWAREQQLSQPGITNIAPPQLGLPVANTILNQPGVTTQTVYSLGTTQPTIAPHQYTAQQIGVAGLQAAAVAPPPALQTAVQLPQPGIAIPTTLATTQVATISYPTPRPPVSGAAQTPPKQQRVFTGNVTKLHDNFGFVDEDVFFQTSCVKGVIPKVGDRVLVEASYNANMPFKWNAARIQVLPNQVNMPVTAVPASQSSFSQPQSTFTQNQPSFSQSAPISYQVKPNMGSGMTPSVAPPSNMSQPPPPLMGQPAQPPGPKRDKGLLQGNPGRSSMVPSRRLENQGFRERERTRDRERSDRHTHERRERRSPRKRSRSPARRSKSPSSRGRSPQRRRQQARIVPRYMVQIPKLSLDSKEGNVITMKSHYSNLYIPSDFFNASFAWIDGFPLHRPFQLGNTCTFHVMSKEVDVLNKSDTNLDPTDADHLYSAKVMLLTMPTTEDLYHKTCALTEDPAEMRDAFQHPTRLIQFLVGMKGKSEPMAIGGPWSPTLDGPNPGEDPRVLIKTAIRTTRSMTGIDLSCCTQWYRFTEIRYHRPEELHKGRLVPARVETVVIFLPDVWSCNPTHLEWEGLQAAYRQQLQSKLTEESKEDTQDEEDDGNEGDSETNKDPTHYAELDPKTMKVADLRKELEARTLSSKGLKSQLIARLTKALKSEQEKEQQDADNKDEQEDNKVADEKKMEIEEKDDEQKRKEDEERKKREEKDRVIRERKYQIPDGPTILVHPSPTAKGGKFDCSVTSLSVLLDYRIEDNKEHSFEVSLFAELFNEMLMRDFGFRIYKALITAPESKKEDDKKDSKDKEVKDKDSKDKDNKDDKDKDTSEEPSMKKRKSSQDGDDKEKIKEEKKEETDKDKDTESKDGDQDDEDMDDDSKDKDRERNRSRDKDKKRDKAKYYTAERDLLLAFVYFDQTHTGYLLDKDVEEIIHTLGLQLSRSQVKKLVQKLVSRDTLNYRKFTDQVQVKDGEKVDEEEESNIVEGTKHDDILLAQGNMPYLEMPKKESTTTDSAEVTSPRSSKRGRKERGEDSGVSEGMVLYNGAMVDINSVMQRLERSEKTRTTVESKYKEMQEEMDAVKTSFSSAELNSQKVVSELQELKKRLRDQKRHMESSESTARKITDVLTKSKASLTSVLADLKSVATDDKDHRSDQVLRNIKTEPVNANGD